MSDKKKYSFFNHKECEFFPCHSTDDPDNFNCLFCYCPLYVLGEKCGGEYKFPQDGYKDCSDCLFPHKRSSYDLIIERYKEIVAFMKERKTL